MNIQDAWEKAVRKTEVVRPRVQPLATFAATHLIGRAAKKAMET